MCVGVFTQSAWTIPPRNGWVVTAPENVISIEQSSIHSSASGSPMLKIRASEQGLIIDFTRPFSGGCDKIEPILPNGRIVQQ
jgi:hypothetical protein